MFFHHNMCDLMPFFPCQLFFFLLYLTNYKLPLHNFFEHNMFCVFLTESNDDFMLCVMIVSMLISAANQIGPGGH